MSHTPPEGRLSRSHRSVFIMECLNCFTTSPSPRRPLSRFRIAPSVPRPSSPGRPPTPYPTINRVQQPFPPGRADCRSQSPHGQKTRCGESDAKADKIEELEDGDGDGDGQSAGTTTSHGNRARLHIAQLDTRTARPITPPEHASNNMKQDEHDLGVALSKLNIENKRND